MSPLVAVLACLWAPGAAAQSNCGQRDAVIDKLAGKFGEAFLGGGLQNAESVFEVWHSEETGTWTILMTRADGVSCIMASGTNWREGIMVPAGRDG